MRQKVDRQKLINFRVKHPKMTMAAMSRVFHITRQRVKQIFDQEDKAAKKEVINH